MSLSPESRVSDFRGLRDTQKLGKMVKKTSFGTLIIAPSFTYGFRVGKVLPPPFEFFSKPLVRETSFFLFNVWQSS